MFPVLGPALADSIPPVLEGGLICMAPALELTDMSLPCEVSVVAALPVAPLLLLLAVAELPDFSPRPHPTIAKLNVIMPAANIVLVLSREAERSDR